MALSKETNAWIASLCGISAEEFSAKVNSTELVAIQKPKGEFFTTEELAERDENKYIEGKDASREMQVKDLKKEYGYEFQGRDIKDFMAHHDQVLRDKYGNSDDSKVVQLKKDLETQKDTYDAEIGTLKAEVEKYTSLYKKSSLSNKLLGRMPKETTIPGEDIITLFNAKHEVREEDGVELVYINGQPIKDGKTGKALPVEEVFSTFVIDNKYGKSPDSRGGDDETGGDTSKYKGVKSPQEFENAWKSENPGKSTAGEEYSKAYEAWRKDSKEE